MSRPEHTDCGNASGSTFGPPVQHTACPIIDEGMSIHVLPMILLYTIVHYYLPMQYDATITQRSINTQCTCYQKMIHFQFYFSQYLGEQQQSQAGHWEDQAQQYTCQ